MKVKCRGCGQPLPEENLIQYANMPKSAQFFPGADELETETGVDIVLKQCGYCGLIQAAGAPVPYYRDVIRASGVSAEMKRFREEQYRSWVKDFRLEGKKIIEVGCGSGEYMTCMEQSGAIVYGLEHLQSSVEQGKRNGHRIWHGFVEDEHYRIPEAPYDGFYIMNYLEHIPDPGSFLRGIAHNLADSAPGIVEVPNFTMMLEKSLYSEFIQDHLSYFTQDTLAAILERNGFEVLSCKSSWYDYILSATVRRRLPTAVGKLADKHRQLKREMKAFLTEQRQKGRRLAVWGAGHQALANLSLLEMAEDIVFVVDSAPFKQDKYTPATHIPIVAPDRLKQGEVDLVMIMAAGYSMEVKRIMDECYPDIDKVLVTEEGIRSCGK